MISPHIDEGMAACCLKAQHAGNGQLNLCAHEGWGSG
jgi:hypothetical protein